MYSQSRTTLFIRTFCGGRNVLCMHYSVWQLLITCCSRALSMWLVWLRNCTFNLILINLKLATFGQWQPFGIVQVQNSGSQPGAVFYFQGTFDNIWRHFWFSQSGCATSHQVRRGQGCVLNILQNAGHHPIKDLIIQKLSMVLKLRNSGLVVQTVSFWGEDGRWVRYLVVF